MSAAQRTTRTPFTLLDIARIVGGRLVAVHHNACPALETGRAEDCRCAETSYKLIREGRARK